MYEPKNTAIDERRGATRFRKEPDAEWAAIWYPHEMESLVEVYDESLQGLALLLNDPKDLYIGLQVEIAYRGNLLQGTVRHMEAHEDGRTKVGFLTSASEERPSDID